MMSDTLLLITILGMAAATAVPRVLPALLPAGWRPGRRLQAFLDAVPFAALGALIVPGVFQIEGGVTAGLAVAGAAAAAALARAPLAITVVIGIAVAWAMAGGVVGG